MFCFCVLHTTSEAVPVLKAKTALLLLHQLQSTGFLVFFTNVSLRFTSRLSGE